MKLHKTSLAIAAAALVAMPVAAQSATARASAPLAGESELAGDITPAFIIAALAGIAMGVLLLVDNDDNDRAVSP